MPTPLGHSLAGLAVYLIFPSMRGRRRWLAALFLIALANLPDIDFLPGYIIGEPRAFHWGPTHSLVAALSVGVAAGAIAELYNRRFVWFFVAATVAYGSHILLDLLLGPGAHSIGLQVFWPFSTERFMAPWSIFQMFPRSIQDVGPVRALFSRSVLPLLLREVLVLVPVCLAFWARARFRRDMPGRQKVV